MKLAHKHLMAAAALAVFSLGAAAQTSPAPQPDAAKMQERGAHMQERMAKRMAEFKQKLQLSPGQELAWSTYTDALKPKSMARMNRDDMAKLTTPERIDRRKAQRDVHMAERDKRADATKTFYAVLTPEQKKTFDELTARRGHHGGGHHGRHHKG